MLGGDEMNEYIADPDPGESSPWKRHSPYAGWKPFYYIILPSGPRLAPGPYSVVPSVKDAIRISAESRMVAMAVLR
jgi:hypothetical protein